jgi:hypothetical protein
MDFSAISLVALDLDDTTLHSDSTLSPATRDAICALSDSGCEVVIASGRAFTALPESMLSLGVVRYAVTSNGAAVNRVPDGHRILSYTLSARAVGAVLAAVPEDIIIEGFVDGVPYSDRRYVADPVQFGCTPAYIPYIQTTRQPVDDVRAFLRVHADVLDSINIVCPTPEFRNKLEPIIAAAADDVYLTNSARHLLELVDHRAGKGAALRGLCEHLGLAASQVAAFGNADNDVDMLRFAGLGVAVANAAPNCLAAADLVTASNNDDGVAKILCQIAAARHA